MLPKIKSAIVACLISSISNRCGDGDSNQSEAGQHYRRSCEGNGPNPQKDSADRRHHAYLGRAYCSWSLLITEPHGGQAETGESIFA